MEYSGDVLSTWRLLISDAPIVDVQNALLSLPATSSYTFDADPTTTSADLDALESGASLLLNLTSPAAKAMARNVHVGIQVVSTEETCCGIFNAKEVRVRMDPVVRLCGSGVSGKGGCTNTAHRAYKLDFTGSRLLIETPVASRATPPAFFSLPYLRVEDLPRGRVIDRVKELKAPVNVWRSFFAGTSIVLPVLMAEAKTHHGLSVSTAFNSPNPGATKDQESPMSFDLVENEDGVEETKQEVVNQEAEEPFNVDFLDADPVQSLQELPLSGPSDVDAAKAYFNNEASKLEQEMFGIQGDDPSHPYNSSSSSSVGSSSSSSKVPSRRDPQTRSNDSSSSMRSKRVPSVIADSTLESMFKQILSNQDRLEKRVFALEGENRDLRGKISRVKSAAAKAVVVAKSADAIARGTEVFARKIGTQIKSEFTKALEAAKEEVLSTVGKRTTPDVSDAMRDLSALLMWRKTLDSRIGSLEVDMRDEDGLLSTLIRECKTALAAGDATSFTAAGYTLTNEESVLAMIQPLDGKNNYGGFVNMKVIFSLCGDVVTNLSENMLLHKATKGADFEDTYSARVNTAYVVPFPSVFGRKSTTGDSVKMVWTSPFKSHAAFAGGMKNGGKTVTERQIRKVVEMCRGQIRRKFPARKYPMQNAVACAMLETAAFAAFDFLDAISNFYFIMTSTGLSPSAAWSNTQDMMLRIFEELEVVSSECGEEDADAGLIWSSMQIANKVVEFQRFRWSEHPCICSMLMFSVLERLGEDRVAPEDSAAADALEECRKNHEAIEDLLDKQKKDHEKAAEALNQVKQLKESIKGKKDSPSK